MKKLSDYQGDQAVDLWADLLDPISEILTDKEVQNVVQSGQAPIVIAKTVLKAHKKEAAEILMRIDPEPLDGFNIVMRLVTILAEIGENNELKAFFGYAAQANTSSATSASSGSVTENTGVSEI